MQFVVLANEILKEELLMNGQNPGVEIEWINTAEEFNNYRNAEVCCDLLFDGSGERIKQLQGMSPTIIISSVEKTLRDLSDSFVRINGWPGFLKGSLIEASCDDERKKQQAEIFFSAFNKKIEWLPDEPGFASARIVSMIINEAYLALGEGVSTQQEIDVAMKLGTNYPSGPFEWARRIGIKKVHALLTELSKINTRYQPAKFLEKEADPSWR